MLAVLAAILFLLSFTGCGMTLGPVVERRAVIVKAGTAIEVIENTSVQCRLLTSPKDGDVFEQDIGGWITMHPDHWESLSAEFKRLREKAGE